MWFRRQGKNSLENYCFVPRNNHKDKLADKLETGHMDEAAQEALNRLDRDPLAEKVVQQQEQLQEQQHEQEQAKAAASEMQSSSSISGTEDSRSQQFQTVQTEKEVRDEESRKRKTRRL